MSHITTHKVALAAILLAGSIGAGAAGGWFNTTLPPVAYCPANFLDGKPPSGFDDSLYGKKPTLYPICYEEFGVLFSSALHTPLWSAEHLTAARIHAGQTQPRPHPDPFHAEEALDPGDTATLGDYSSASKAWDRGHMSPNHDQSTPHSQWQSFTLANVVPQHPCNNEQIWEQIENATRDLAITDQDIYVVTGPVYATRPVQTIGRDHVGVPSHIFKAIYDATRHQAGVYITLNTADQRWEIMSLDQLQASTGIDVFPSLPAATKQTAMKLPEPGRAHYKCRLQ